MSPVTPAKGIDLSSATAVVTGATHGIGRSVVEALVARGARVGCVARSADDLAELAGAVGRPGQLAVARADVGNRPELEGALDTLAGAHGPVDVLVNNAGVGLYGPVVHLDPADAERLMRTNYLGTMYATCAVLPGMIERGRGHIANVASIAGLLGTPFEAAYAASKFAVVGFTEALAVEAAPFGVGVSMVNPGPVATEFFTARGHPYARSRPRPIAPEVVAASVLRGIEHGRFEQTLPRSLAFAPVVRHLLPRLYLRGTRLAMRRELAQLAREIRTD
ncbi:MAG TPA: SDR family NAD(P)-dependent oxidoreductase [Acidimicrobiales bacterium]|nr:SDR family NAD(P)-dependent oxidoreductase [Acidimicrobiales bacterium]